MIKRVRLIRIIKKLNALIKKNILLDSRFKLNIISRIINPIVQLILYFFLFGLIFSNNVGFSLGYWRSNTYVLFLLIGFNIQYIRKIQEKFRRTFLLEKYWKTLQALLLSPINKFLLLISIIFSELIIISIPFSIILVFAFLFNPISIINLILVLMMFLSISLIIGSIGLILGVFTISNENIAIFLNFCLRFIFLFSCISFPIQVFPQVIHIIILINPFYYIFDLVRLVWLMGIEYHLAIIYLTPIHISVFCVMIIIFPICSIIMFNKVYKKYGITGY